MNTKLLYLLLPLTFTRGLASSEAVSLDEQFLEAAMEGHVDRIPELLGKGVWVNVTNDSGLSALHLASYRGHLDCVKVLIAAKANINACSRIGRTALHAAAQKGHLGCMRALIDANIDVSSLDNINFTALQWAVKSGNLDCVKTLVKYSYGLVTSKAVSESRKRIFNVLLQFVRLRNEHPELDNLKDITLQHEILTRNKLLQEDLAIIFLDELKKGKDIKSVILIRSKEAAISYLLTKVKEIFQRTLELYASIPGGSLPPAMATFLDSGNLEDIHRPLIKEGLNERIEQLKSKKSE